MKSIILIRHTKSDWSNIVADFDRPIRADRQNDAVLIAKEIARRNAIPQMLMASPARRTMQTAELITAVWKMVYKDITTAKELYEGSVQDILNVINGCDEKYDAISVVCHNPAITKFINQYSDSTIDNVSTTGAGLIFYEVNKWQDIDAKGKLKWFCIS